MHQLLVLQVLPGSAESDATSSVLCAETKAALFFAPYFVFLNTQLCAGFAEEGGGVALPLLCPPTQVFCTSHEEERPWRWQSGNDLQASLSQDSKTPQKDLLL